MVTRWARKGRVPSPEEERRFMKEKKVLARDRLWLKWWEVFRAGDSQYPSHLSTHDGWKTWPSNVMGEIAREDLSLWVRE